MEFAEPVSGDFVIELANQAGQVVFQRKARLNNNRSLGFLVDNPPPPGIYFLRARQVGSPKVYAGKLFFRR